LSLHSAQGYGRGIEQKTSKRGRFLHDDLDEKKFSEKEKKSCRYKKLIYLCTPNRKEGEESRTGGCREGVKRD
ncbi:hypothetical protein ABIB40_004244, partial [Pedobacter sp. UYP30]|uniref:hypothetical protein n=1 Tax=Pedobacter sp. UYP30 TaxID=1756400 RepID=UPI003399521C